MIKIVKIGIDNSYYPDRLRIIKKPPKCIYAIGDIDILKNNGIAIVGSRNSSEYGERWCKYFTEKLVDYDLNIISGLAIGIDSFAHNACLKKGGKTIAVLPSGFNNIYPKENKKLFNEIIENGGIVITEYEPDEKAKTENFINRNRIVSGISIATLVIEAGYRSGTSITAKNAIEQGKNVFCLPNSLDNKNGIGTNYLIKNGAFLVTEIEDIISKYDFLKNKKIDNVKKNKKVNPEYEKLYNLLGREPISIEDLIKESGMPANEVFSKITIMEIDEVIKIISENKIVKI